ncbi:unnamed protein product [Mucor hiemalis]
MSDNENNGSGGSPIDNQKDLVSTTRLAVPDPETKAPHFVPSEDTNTNDKTSSSRRKKWEEKSDSEEEPDVKPRSSTSNNNNSNSTQTKEEASTENISIRSLVGTKDAGVIIGRGGKNVSDIRELSSARVTISEIVPGAYERILTVSGPVNAVAKAYSLVGEKFSLNIHSLKKAMLTENKH